MRKLAFLFCLIFLSSNFAFAGNNYYCPKQLKCKRIDQERYCEQLSEGILINEGLIGWGGDIFEGVYKLFQVFSYKGLVSCIYDPTFPSAFSVINVAFQHKYKANQEGATKWQLMNGSKEFLKCESISNLEPQDCPLSRT